jgi:AraC-like DNA-binding protein
MEFCIFAVLRLCRELSDRRLVPEYLTIAHVRSKLPPTMKRFVGREPQFGADVDEFALNAENADLRLLNHDPCLNQLLLDSCEESLANRNRREDRLRTKVENALAVRLPHGTTNAKEIARDLGMSERTLSRKLAEEGTNFTKVLQQLRVALATHRLSNQDLQISQIAWLLGFSNVSAFTHAVKHWTGKTPSQLRASAASG